MSYNAGINSICDDKLKITVVKLNLGVAVYRKMTISLWENYEQTGLVSKYAGKRLFNELSNNEKWETIEEGPGGNPHK